MPIPAYPTFAEALSRADPKPDPDDYNIPPGENLVEFAEYRDEISPTGLRRFALCFVSAINPNKSVWHSLFETTKGNPIRSIKHAIPLMANLVDIDIDPINSMDDAIPALEKLLHHQFRMSTKLSTRNGMVHADISTFLIPRALRKPPPDKPPNKPGKPDKKSLPDDPINDLFEGYPSTQKTETETPEQIPESEAVELGWQVFFRHMYDYHRELNRLRQRSADASIAKATTSLEYITKILKKMLEDTINAK